MSITFLTWAISLAAYYPAMSLLDSKGFKEIMYFIFAGLTSTEQQLKLKHSKKKKLQRKSATIIMQFTNKFTSGLTLALTISEELPLSGTKKSVNKSSWTLTKTEK